MARFRGVFRSWVLVGVLALDTGCQVSIAIQPGAGGPGGATIQAGPGGPAGAGPAGPAGTGAGTGGAADPGAGTAGPPARRSVPPPPTGMFDGDR